MNDKFVAFVLVVAIIILIASCSMASSHEWYPTDCCSQKDCFRVDDEKRIIDDGTYLILDHKIKFLKAAKKFSPDGKYHVCVSGQNPRCIFVPEPQI